MLHLRKKQVVVANEAEDFAVNLTLHDFPASLLTEFVENIVGPYYDGNLNAAVQDLMHKSLAEQEFVHNHITMIRDKSTH